MHEMAVTFFMEGATFSIFGFLATWVRASSWRRWIARKSEPILPRDGSKLVGRKASSEGRCEYAAFQCSIRGIVARPNERELDLGVIGCN